TGFINGAVERKVILLVAGNQCNHIVAKRERNILFSLYDFSDCFFRTVKESDVRAVARLQYKHSHTNSSTLHIPIFLAILGFENSEDLINDVLRIKAFGEILADPIQRNRNLCFAWFYTGWLGSHNAF